MELLGRAAMLRGRPHRHDTIIPTGRVWPSGEFSVGYRRVAGDRRGRMDVRSHRRRIDDGDLLCPARPGWSIGPHGFPQFDPEAAGPLDLTPVPNSHKPRHRPDRYGRLGITGYGRRMVRSAATILQRRPRTRVTFATITMPPLLREQRAALAREWPELVRQLLQSLGRQLKRQQLPAIVVSVTEVQPKRLATTGEAYLHLHLVWPNHAGRAGNWAVDPKAVRAWCEKFLRRRGLWQDGAWVNVDVQPVKKSAANYLSKYMSKGSGQIEAIAADLGWECVPSQWWNMTNDARQAIRGEMRSGDGVGQALLNCISSVFRSGDLRGILKLHEIMLETPTGPRGVGWAGLFSHQGRLEFVAGLAGP